MAILDVITNRLKGRFAEIVEYEGTDFGLACFALTINGEWIDDFMWDSNVRADDRAKALEKARFRASFEDFPIREKLLK